MCTASILAQSVTQSKRGSYMYVGRFHGIIENPPESPTE